MKGLISDRKINKCRALHRIQILFIKEIFESNINCLILVGSMRLLQRGEAVNHVFVAFRLVIQSCSSKTGIIHTAKGYRIKCDADDGQRCRSTAD